MGVFKESIRVQPCFAPRRSWVSNTAPLFRCSVVYNFYAIVAGHISSSFFSLRLLTSLLFREDLISHDYRLVRILGYPIAVAKRDSGGTSRNEDIQDIRKRSLSVPDGGTPLILSSIVFRTDGYSSFLVLFLVFITRIPQVFLVSYTLVRTTTHFSTPLSNATHLNTMYRIVSTHIANYAYKKARGVLYTDLPHPCFRLQAQPLFRLWIVVGL